MRFQDVIGQEAAAARMVRAVQANRLSHAQLIAGPSGVGQLPFAWALAQYALCLNPSETDSCGVCKACQRVASLQHPDLIVVVPVILKSGGKTTTDDYLDELRVALAENPWQSLEEWGQRLGAENKQVVVPIAEMRQVQQKLSLKAFGGSRKVVLFWGPDRLNHEAANAFLKTLEEPPGGTLLLLATEQPRKLLTTVISRTQRINLRPVAPASLATWLVSHADLTLAQAEVIAPLAEGSVTEAIQLASGTEHLPVQAFQDWMKLCYAGKFHDLQAFVAVWASASKSAQQLLIRFALQRFRDALLMKSQASRLTTTPPDQRAFLVRFSLAQTADSLQRMTKALEAASYQLTRNAHAGLVFTEVSLQLHRALRAGARGSQAA